MSSQAGKVIYCGNEIPGYGNLILIKHSKNWITAYAHLNEVFTEKGKKVSKGEIIGSVGNTGNVRSPQLHFEIRKGKKYIKVINQNAVKCFIVNTTEDKVFEYGDILKPAGWNAPARNYKRGNVLEGNYLMNWTGPVYMS